MHQLMSDLGGVIDQLNPLSRQNQIVYLVWLAAYVFTAGAVWRCGRRWLRLVYLLVLQVLSVGLFVSQANILILAIYLWQESLVVAVAAMLTALWAFRTRRKRKRTAAARQERGHPRTVPATVNDGPVTAVILAAEQDVTLPREQVSVRGGEPAPVPQRP